MNPVLLNLCYCSGRARKQCLQELKCNNVTCTSILSSHSTAWNRNRKAADRMSLQQKRSPHHMWPLAPLRQPIHTFPSGERFRNFRCKTIVSPRLSDFSPTTYPVNTDECSFTLLCCCYLYSLFACTVYLCFLHCCALLWITVYCLIYFHFNSIIFLIILYSPPPQYLFFSSLFCVLLHRNTI